ncbi:MAG: rhodanese-like domain-containing protein [Elusimicrobia bacterium]|nr:rhodanese-like domain-containing protein [Elusimicrobiota bacterium]
MIHSVQLPATEPIAKITPPLAREIQKNERSIVFVDVRSPAEYVKGHIKGALNVPVADLRTSTIPQADLVVVYCPDEGCARSDRAAYELLGLGIANVRVLEGGLAGWQQYRYPVEPAPAAARVVRMLPAELRRLLVSSKMIVIDTRRHDEFVAGHVPGAVNLPLEGLPESLASMENKGPCVVYDRLQERARQAAMILAESGREARELVGGIGAWSKKGYPMAVGNQSEVK